MNDDDDDDDDDEDADEGGGGDDCVPAPARPRNLSRSKTIHWLA